MREVTDCGSLNSYGSQPDEADVSWLCRPWELAVGVGCLQDVINNGLCVVGRLLMLKLNFSSFSRCLL